MNKEPLEFQIETVTVSYVKNYFNSETAPHDHFDLRSFNVSETGYQSHFAPSDEVNDAGGYLEYIKKVITELWIEPDNQLDLF